ncbi:SPRY domain-containing SOCS box protein 4 [Oryzias melastigma]|uniref:SPRY domain-containing SOCS box protein 4-like n=1 Tax=Oryzias melastigma TaxID=30732 RepID=A0A3B3D279_ORYME|nr:SPRY domain-containing SOCS box protein 4 [Oryzias melastigma]XP_024122617.1 SPRY domain-containing SOCS box protein 4 [Oryzias melastigma]
MGLFMSVWFNDRTTQRTPPTPSAFLPLTVPTSSRLALILAASPISPVDRRSHWSSQCSSPHFLLSPCKQEVTRTPAEMSSDGVRAEVGVKGGLHLWELLWSPKHRGSHAVVGVSTLDCPLQGSGYNVLLGGDSQSWGWELVSNQLWHAGKMLEPYPGKEKMIPSTNADSLGPELSSSSNTKESAALLIPERVLLVLDADAGTLGFVVDGNFLGVAFKDLPRGVELFPAVSSVRGGARIQLRYLNGSTCEPPPLMALCGLSIRRVLGNQEQNHLKKLPLPPYLQHYLFCSY